ncbi:MAG: xylulokinase [Ruminococcaceae bacterium]|nr:xylulokinase [Oscillospiraceae bacterium]MBR3595506.1 xylulokinase [Clostridia bacterium]
MFYIGIDLGTSSVKLLLSDEKGNILKTASREYPLIFPREGWSEQDPAEWWRGTKAALREITENIDTALIKGIGVAGQMHGLVILDENDEVIRPAILWNDGRTEKEVEYLNNIIGKEKLSQYTGNIAFAGFTAPKILWLKENEPENFRKIKKIMLPKDYINYLLTGVHACDYSDASGMLLLDVKRRCWSKEMLSICSISEGMMPCLFESSEVIGEVKKEFRLPFAKVVAGAGDNAAAAIGTGTVGNGRCNISLGTSGTVFISSDSFSVDEVNSLHSFCHADGKYHLMGCMLSAASCNKWFSEDILKENDFGLLQKDINDENLGNNSIYFLPYLMGERSPINDTDARGVFLGLSLDTKREDMVLAVLEGVSFAIRDSFEVAKGFGLDITESCLVGGGAKSPLWRKILANVLGIKLNILKTEQGPGMGAVILAMVGTGLYPSVNEAVSELTEIAEFIIPDSKLTALYEDRYNKYRQIYPALKGVFKNIK